MAEEALEEKQLTEAREKPPSAGFALAQSDCEIFELIYEFRFLRREHLSILTGRSPKRMHARLITLVERRYLTVIRLPQQKHIYALAKRALPVLVEQGIGTSDLLSERVRTHELKELFLKHEMMLVDIHVMLSLASRDPASHFRLIQWRAGSELIDSVSFIDRGSRQTLPVRPDAFFTVEDVRRPAPNVASYFLEADRSTASQARFREKILGYFHYHDQELHLKKFNIKTFRVLTVTLTKPRADNLCRMAASLPVSSMPERARKYFAFTSLDQLTVSGHMFDSVYQFAKAPGQLRPLIPSPQPE